MKDILKSLRELKRSTPLAFQMLKVFSEGQDSSSVSFCYVLVYRSCTRKTKDINNIIHSYLPTGAVES